MRFEQLAYLISIVRCRSLNKAAQELFTSQPALSKAIEALEDELNCKLLIRTRQGTIPTAEGVRVYEDACEILRITDAWRDFRAFTPESAGEVHLIGTGTFCDFLSNGFLLTLRQAFPHLDLILHDGKRDEVVEQMLYSDYKLGVVSLVSKQYSDPRETALFASMTQRQTWEADLLLKDPRQVLVSAKNPLAAKPCLTVEDLKGLPLAAYSGPDEIIQNYHSYFSPGEFYRLHNRGSIFRFVAEDRAAAIFPTITTSNDHYIETGPIRALPVEGLALPASRFFLIHPSKRVLRPAERIVMDMLVEFFRAISPTQAAKPNRKELPNE